MGIKKALMISLLFALIIFQVIALNQTEANKQEQRIDKQLPISYEDYELNKGESEMKNFLPIGSVVLLKESTKRIMIVGVKQKEVDTEKVWDYSACLYPEGIWDPTKLYLFDAKQIDIVFSLGFQDDEGIKFNEALGQSEN